MAIQAKASQEIVPIKEIRNDVVVLKDNTLVMVLMASTLNFALKSADEQSAILLQFQNFLNSLDFPVQFFIESRKLNINSYIAILEEAEKAQANELLKIQTREYVEFIKSFVASISIVSKTFYVVVSYRPSAIGAGKGILGGLFPKKTAMTNETGEFEKNKLQLQKRTDVVSQGLKQAGVRIAVLETEELIELFFKLFNPGEIEKEMIRQYEKETTPR